MYQPPSPEEQPQLPVIRTAFPSCCSTPADHGGIQGHFSWLTSAKRRCVDTLLLFPSFCFISCDRLVLQMVLCSADSTHYSCMKQITSFAGLVFCPFNLLSKSNLAITSARGSEGHWCKHKGNTAGACAYERRGERKKEQGQPCPAVT